MPESLKVVGLRSATLAQVFSCEFCEVLKNTIFFRTLLDEYFCFQNLIGEGQPTPPQLFKTENFATIDNDF